MGSPSKENDVLELFFNYATKHWHFESVLKESNVSRQQTSKWLNRLIKEKIIKKVKLKGKMPYYIGDWDSPSYHNKKKLYAMSKFYETGFLDHLSTLQKADVVVIFGSFARSDWHKDSDIDLFIYGSADEFEISKFEEKLKRDIQVFEFKSLKKLKENAENLIPPISRGMVIKGNLEFKEVSMNA